MATTEYVSETTEFSAGIKRLLIAADDEFVPPLSAREGTTQRDGLDDSSSASEVDISAAIEPYHSACLDQHLIACHDAGELYGFMSFRQGYTTTELGEYQPSNYISTIIVAPDHRRRGIARQLYETVLHELPSGVESPYITTRTWSSNDSHLSLLDELGFEKIHTIPNDRGPGVDTVYYGLSRPE